MDKVFKLLKQKNIEYLDAIKNNKIPQEKSDFIIMSGAGILFVQYLIDRESLEEIVFKKISFSCTNDKKNPERVHIGSYHNHNCPDCDIALCKGIAIEEVLSEVKKERDVIYDKVAFFGDGDNDFCAGVHLKEVEVFDKTLFCVREHHYLEKMVFDISNKKKDIKKL